ncbi:MAG TPA: hypothetical protein VLB69_03555 [Rudaea sp.]|nr:hypothetical protein [Rudaea sp.]
MRTRRRSPPLFVSFLLWVACVLGGQPAIAQPVLFDFDAPVLLHASLPLDITQSGLTAHLSATGDGYSIQDPMQTILMLPAGFSGYALNPNGVFLADLLVRFDVLLSDFSIMVAPQELACDTTATLRVTGYLGTTFVATATVFAAPTDPPPPYMWSSSTLSLSAAQGFDHLVVHYDSPPPPPACDYGPIFVADNMSVTPSDKIFANGFE